MPRRNTHSKTAGKYENHNETRVGPFDLSAGSLAVGSAPNAVAGPTYVNDNVPESSVEKFIQQQQNWDAILTGAPLRSVDPETSIVSLVRPGMQWHDWPLYNALHALKFFGDADMLTSNERERHTLTVLEVVYGSADKAAAMLSLFGADLTIDVEFSDSDKRIGTAKTEQTDDFDAPSKQNYIEHTKFMQKVKGPRHEVGGCHRDFDNSQDEAITVAQGFVNVAGINGAMASTIHCRHKDAAHPFTLLHAAPIFYNNYGNDDAYGEFARFFVEIKRNERTELAVKNHFENSRWPWQERTRKEKQFEDGAVYMKKRAKLKLLPISYPMPDGQSFKKGEAGVQIQRFAGDFYE